MKGQIPLGVLVSRSSRGRSFTLLRVRLMIVRRCLLLCVCVGVCTLLGVTLDAVLTVTIRVAVRVLTVLTVTDLTVGRKVLQR